ncbi:hypothetical protein PMAYCL1PPCAC_22960 [Pristionchus mayeri]|uniref:Uncharacterized protein n=1 Tax=Pristionchus mayeri TaxID=1317129 RepID=A0AAN5CYU0_9BILA|nr:hypothetical protein PMAYCL1PPCAC_22960 [Pristionchus mayeri]
MSSFIMYNLCKRDASDEYVLDLDGLPVEAKELNIEDVVVNKCLDSFEIVNLPSERSMWRRKIVCEIHGGNYKRRFPVTDLSINVYRQLQGCTYRIHVFDFNDQAAHHRWGYLERHFAFSVETAYSA